MNAGRRDGVVSFTLTGVYLAVRRVGPVSMWSETREELSDLQRRLMALRGHL